MKGWGDPTKPSTGSRIEFAAFGALTVLPLGLWICYDFKGLLRPLHQ
jgi:hypothetical protein